MTRFEPILAPSVLDRLQVAVRANFTSPQVAEVLGLAGEAALARSDRTGVDRLTRDRGGPTGTLIRLFVLGLPVPEQDATRALHPLTLADAVSAGLVQPAGASTVCAALDLRPYSQAGGPDWWVLSDLGSDIRPGPLDPEHVLGIGSAATTLAQATVREPAARALDVGTGCGVQALHLSRHCASVLGTDLSPRALSFAAATAWLNGLDWELRAGSLLEPVEDETFDLIVCNPPFIVGPGFTPGVSGYTYRDSGLAGDSVCAQLIGQLPARLAPGATAQLLANWIIDADEPWSERVSGWLPADPVCDAWIWQREVVELGEYVSMWLRDAGQLPGTPAWQSRYDHWIDWFDAAGVLAIGMGLVNLRRTDAAAGRVVCEDVPQPHEQPISDEIAGWFQRSGWLREHDLPGARLVAAPGLVLETKSLIGDQGWQPAVSSVRQSHGMRWELEVDDAVSALLAACARPMPLAVLFELVAAGVGMPTGPVAEALTPVVADLVSRGFLLPAGAG